SSAICASSFVSSSSTFSPITSRYLPDPPASPRSASRASSSVEACRPPFSLSFNLQQSLLHREPNQLRPRLQPQLLHQVALMRLDGLHADDEIIRDLFIGIPFGDPA